PPRAREPRPREKGDPPATGPLRADAGRSSPARLDRPRAALGSPAPLDGGHDSPRPAAPRPTPPPAPRPPPPARLDRPRAALGAPAPLDGGHDSPRRVAHGPPAPSARRPAARGRAAAGGPSA